MYYYLKTPGIYTYLCCVYLRLLKCSGKPWFCFPYVTPSAEVTCSSLKHWAHYLFGRMLSKSANYGYTVSTKKTHVNKREGALSFLQFFSKSQLPVFLLPLLILLSCFPSDPELLWTSDRVVLNWIVSLVVFQ